MACQALFALIFTYFYAIIEQGSGETIVPTNTINDEFILDYADQIRYASYNPYNHIGKNCGIDDVPFFQNIMDRYKDRK